MEPLTLDLRGHTAVVTGGAGLLGRVMVRTLAACGADVAIHYHTNQQKAEELVGELASAGVRAGMFQADVTVESEVRRLHDEVTRKLGTCDIVVNNAVSHIADWRSILEQPVEDYESLFRSCAMQNVLMAQSFVPAMKEKGWGRVIAISTECVVQNYSGQSAYAVAKRGMDGLLKILAKEVGAFGITVNQVAPGWTVTERTRESGSVSQPDYENRVPLKRRGTDQEIANVVAFLASDLASFITGAFIPVCGGNVMLGI